MELVFYLQHVGVNHFSKEQNSEENKKDELYESSGAQTEAVDFRGDQGTNGGSPLALGAFL